MENQIQDNEKLVQQNDDLVLEVDVPMEITEIDVRDFKVFPPKYKVTDAVKDYLNEIGDIPLLTAEEEIELSKKIQAGIKAQALLEEDPNNKELLDTIAKGKIARDKLVSSNYKLVVSIAKKYTNRGLDLLDLIQEGNMKLLVAADKFDYTMGNKFSTYANCWINQGISRALSDKAKTIRLPVHMQDLINRMRKVQRELFQKNSREATPKELAEALEISEQKVLDMQRYALDTISLETKVGEEEDSVIGDFVSDTKTPQPSEYAIKRKMMEEIDNVLSELSDKEEQILRLRYGLTPDGKIKTLEEIGAIFGVTRERIRQIQEKAIRKLQSPSRSKRLREYYGKN